jgi:hypothetical protein
MVTAAGTVIGAVMTYRARAISCSPPGAARRIRDGEVADLRNVTDYPVEAICLGCGRPVRIERFYLSESRHIPEPGS